MESKSIVEIERNYSLGRQKREKLRERIVKEFAEIEANCRAQHNADVAFLRKIFESEFKTTEFARLKAVVETKQELTP